MGGLPRKLLRAVEMARGVELSKVEMRPERVRRTGRYERDPDKTASETRIRRVSALRAVASGRARRFRNSEKRVK